MFFPDDDNRAAAIAGAAGQQPVSSRMLGRRNVLAGIAGMGVAGGLGITRVLAQETDPTPSDPQTTDSGGTIESDTGEENTLNDGVARGEKYQDFVAKLAANLGESDPATVDTAIRDSLKSMVDDVFNAGDISKNAATSIKEAIDTSDAPIAVAMLGGMRERVLNQRGGRHGHRDASANGDGDGETSDDSAPTSDATLTTTT